MKRIAILICLSVWVGVSTNAGELSKDGKIDFFGLARYPEGGKLVEGVDLYEVQEGAGGPADRYTRRVVDWWPRKGVDVIEPTENMPLRTWTLREPGEYYLPRQFKAHLCGFRGFGNHIGRPFRGDGSPLEPAVVLRMPDGSKRCFVRGSFSEEDKQYIMDLYLKEMKRIKAGLDKTEYKTKPKTKKEYPGDAEIGEPGTLRLESDHFVFKSGSQQGGAKRWINPEHPDKARLFRQGSLTMAEYYWAYSEYIGHLMPYWDRHEKYRYEVVVGPTKKDGYDSVGGGCGGGYGACSCGEAGPWNGGLMHEWGHGSPLGNTYALGGGEIYADWHQALVDPGIAKSHNNVSRPWRCVVHGSYQTALFYTTMGQDPNWGYGWFDVLPKGVEEWSTLMTIARVGERRGLFENGIRGLGDMVGEYAARLAEFDTERQHVLRKSYFAVHRNWLQPLDREKGLYRVAREEAPEPFGANVFRLVPEKGAETIVVDFHGLHNPEVYSDWRACIVAVGKDGKARYSSLWNKGKMTMRRRKGDRRYWLTVAATPTAFVGSKDFYQGPHAIRYPYRVRLEGARPGTPRHMRPDADDYKCVYHKPRVIGDRVPGNWECPQAERYKQINGAPHPNGGGWVADTAKVAPTAYVGPHAMVLGQAKVLDHAVIEHYVVVTDHAVVAGHARVGGQAVIKDKARVDGYARTWHPLGEEDEASVVPGPVPRTGLWANYAMNQPENVMLEDWYRRTKNWTHFHVLNLDGYLVGRPEFLAEGDHRGFRFDGESQYAELSPRAADLGAITVALEVKWNGKGSQTLLDFGSGTDNCFRLITEGKDGGPALKARAQGRKVLELAASDPLPTGEWVRLRLEIDGEAAALWMDGEKVAEKASDFRPADAFKPGVAKRNVIAAARDGTEHFEGVFDEVVIYHKVHGEAFEDLREPMMDTPRRPRKGFVKWVRTQKTMSPYERKHRIEEAKNQALRDYRRRAVGACLRLYELRHRCPEWENALKAARQWKERSEKDRKKTKADIVDRLKEAQKTAYAPYKPEADALDSFVFQSFGGYYNGRYSGYLSAYYARKYSNPSLDVDLSRAWSLANKGSETNWMTGINQWDWRTKWEADGSVMDLPLTKQWLIKRVRGELVMESPVKGRKQRSMTKEALKAKIEEVEKELRRIEEEARAAVEQMPETAAAKKEMARLKKEIKAIEERSDPQALLKKAYAEAEQRSELIKKVREEVRFVGSEMYGRSGWWRMRRAKNGVMGKARQIHQWAVRQELKRQNPVFRQWGTLKRRLEQLEQEQRYRTELYFIRHTKRSVLQDQLKRLEDKLKSR